MATHAPIEAKVKSATATALIVGALIEILNAVAADHSLLGPLPPWLQGLILVAAPAAMVLAAGYQARHTPRGDAGAVRDLPRL